MKFNSRWRRRFAMLAWLWRTARREELLMMLPTESVFPDFITAFVAEGDDARFAELETELPAASVEVVRHFRERLHRGRRLLEWKAEGMFHRSMLAGAPDEAEIEYLSRWRQEAPERASQPGAEMSVEYFHHGLRFAPESVRRYIAGKVFVDAGAYHGESAFVLAGYDPARILAFELSPSNAAVLSRNLKRAGKDAAMITPFVCGLGSSEREMRIFDDGTESTRVDRGGDTPVRITTLDQVMREYREPLGFVKADVEGAALDMLRGMTEVLRRDRPVLTLYVYHSPEEFFGCFEYLRQPGFNYHLEFQHHDAAVNIGEIALVAVPAEVMP